MADLKTFMRNKKYAKPSNSYVTRLDPAAQQEFGLWVQQNKIPYDPSPASDYDMAGFYQALKANDPRATTAINVNDHRLHFPDYWKTPYHQSFSNESRWALPTAPRWNESDQLVLPNGQVVFDERAR